MDRRGFLGETLLHYLAVEGFADGVRLLALHGASLDAKNKFGETALIDVALQGNLEMVELLLECGANPLIQSDSDGDTALHAAVNGRNPSVICRLRSIPGLASVRNHENLTAIELEEDLAKVRSPEHRS
jgi:ankyrin repeat protein